MSKQMKSTGVQLGMMSLLFGLYFGAGFEVAVIVGMSYLIYHAVGQEVGGE